MKFKKVVYVRETSGSLKERLKENETDIRLKPVDENYNKIDGYSFGTCERK